MQSHQTLHFLSAARVYALDCGMGRKHLQCSLSLLQLHCTRGAARVSIGCGCQTVGGGTAPCRAQSLSGGLAVAEGSSTARSRTIHALLPSAAHGCMCRRWLLMQVDEDNPKKGFFVSGSLSTKRTHYSLVNLANLFVGCSGYLSFSPLILVMLLFYSGG